MRKTRTVLAIAVIVAGIALTACARNAVSHPAARASLRVAASAAATNPAVIQAESNVGQAIGKAFAPGQKHHWLTLISTLRSDPMFAVGSGHRDASCMVTWLLAHHSVSQQQATAASTACAQGKQP